MGAQSRMTALEAYALYANLVRDRVDRAVVASLGSDLASERELGADVGRVVEALFSLGTRGGKRIRAVLLSLAYEGLGGEGGAERVTNAAVAIELLQVYMLVHDDWMDGDLVRRGGPSVHKMLADGFGSTSLGDATAILAGDFACALAQEAMLSVDAKKESLVAAARRFARIQHDVVLGQVMDVCGELRSIDDLSFARVERMHAKKTGAYTVGGPLAIGALLAGAGEAQVAAIDAFAEPLGIAFQLRDDVLGTFAASEKTGKARFGDLRQGKRTALVASFVAVAEPAGLALLNEVLGRADADESAFAKLADLIESSGARARVDARVSELLAIAHQRLPALGFRGEEAFILEGAITSLGERAS
jgi:geranylgeranyl diphosphate synthase, type I